MAKWKKGIGKGLHKSSYAVISPYTKVKHAYKKRFRRYDDVRIVPYRGYGNRETLYLIGRVLSGGNISTPEGEESWHKNARAMIRRFNTEEVPQATLQLRYHDALATAITDDEGYFTFEIEPDAPASPEKLWHTAQLTLQEGWSTERRHTQAAAEIMVPPADAEYGVISDIDDTVLESHAFDSWRMIKLAITHNSRTRSAFEGAAAFYQALSKGSDGSHANPFFYVSSSAWNIYDFLEDFLDFQGFPKGPVLLRDIGIDRDKFITGGHGHKLDKIERILNTCESVPFILIGDSGQRDPYLYQKVVEMYPGRIKAIYIRDVIERHREPVQAISEELERQGVPMLLVPHTQRAAEHAAAQEWVLPSAPEKVEEKRREEEILPEA